MLHPDPNHSLVEQFTTKATAVAARVSPVHSFEDAVDYCINLCNQAGIDRQATLAATDFDSAQTLQLQSACQRDEIELITTQLRNHLHGVDVGFTRVDYGIADTGTAVLNCPDENLRLSTMICDYHVCLLKTANIVKNSDQLTDQLNRFMQNTPNYTAFISGPSRTADIERVLTIGVHGPLELHILLLEE